MSLGGLDAELDGLPGTFSVYCGRPGEEPVYTRDAGATHYAASTMKLAILVALHRSGHDLDREVKVHNDFRSAAAGAPNFGCTRDYDNDDAVWERVGSTASLDWLSRRMIVRSSNLATNLVLENVGLNAVREAWAAAGATRSTTGRGIEDYAAREAGITNEVTAADLAAVLSAIHLGALPGADRMLDILLAQECTEDLAAGLPPGTRIAHKNGWVDGVRHGAGLIFPTDAPPYVLVACATTPLAVNDPGDEACRTHARIAAASWDHRHR